MAPKRRRSLSSTSQSWSLFSNSSNSSVASQHTLALRRTFIPSPQKLFPVLEQLDVSLDWKITVIGLLIETLQLVALVFNMNFTWGPTFGPYVSKVVYFFLLPLFDSKWAANATGAAIAFFWIFLVITGVALGLFLHYVRQEFHRIPKLFRAFLQGVMHIWVSFGLLPVAMSFMSFIACNTSNTSLYWFPSTKCYSGYGLVAFAFGIVGLLLLGLVLLLSSCFLFADMPDSTNLTARPGGLVTCSTTVMKLSSAIMFHVLLSKGHPKIFAAVFCTLCGIQAILYVVFLPYYSMRMTQLRVAQMLVVVAFAGVAAADVPASSAWHAKSISTIVVILLAIAGAVGGWFLALARLNGDYARAVEALQHNRVMLNADSLTPTYPTSLPEHDLVFTRYPTIEKIIMGDTTHGRNNNHNNNSSNNNAFSEVVSENSADGRHGGASGGGGGAGRLAEDEEEPFDQWSILDPYVSQVFFASDVEVATRFLREFTVRTGAIAPTPRMCVFAARIFTKGMVKYRNDPYLVYHFSIFLSLYAHKLRMGLAEITLLQRSTQHIPLMLSYRLYCMSETLKRALNVSNSHQIQLMSVSTELHKEILGAMSSFWGHLTSGSHTSEQLANVADYITAKREHCKAFYEKTLQMPTEAILLNYAKFLRDVMLDDETAKALSERVAEEAEMYRQQQRAQHARGDGGSHRGAGGSISNVSRVGANWQSCKMVLKNAKARQAERTNHSDFSQGSNEISTLRITVFVVFAIILLVVIGMMVAMGIRIGMLATTVDRIHAATTSRLYVTVGEYLVGQLKYFYESSLPESQKEPILSFIKQRLLKSAEMLKESHNSLTLGKLYTGSSTITEYMNVKRMEIIEPGTLSLEGNQARVLIDVFNLGFRIASDFTEIAENYGKTLSAATATSFVLANAQEFTFGRAFNRTVDAYVKQRNDFIKDTIWISVVLFCVAVFLLLFVYCIVLVYLRRIEVNKVATINLFSLIPRSYLEDLYGSSREKIRNFDKEDEILAQHHQEKNNGNGGKRVGLHAVEDENSGGKSKKAVTIVAGSNNGRRRDVNEKEEKNLDTIAEHNRQRANGKEANTTTLDDAVAAAVDVDVSNNNRHSDNWDSAGMRKREEREGYQVTRAANGDTTAPVTYSDDDLELSDEDRAYNGEEDDTVYDRHAISHYITGLSDALANPAFLMGVLILCTVIAVASFGTGYSLYTATGSIRDVSDTVNTFKRLSTSYYKAMSALGEHAQQYTLTGDLVHVERYYDYLVANDFYNEISYGILNEASTEVVQAILNIRVVLNSALLRQQVAMWLASLFYKVPSDQSYLFSRIGASRQPYDFTALTTLLQEIFADYNPIVSLPTATTPDEDELRPPQQMIEVAQNLVFDDYYTDHRYLMVKNLNIMSDGNAGSGTREFTKQRSLAIATLVLVILCAVLLLISIRGAFVRGDVAFVTRLALFITFGISVVAIALLVVTLSAISDAVETHEQYSTYMNAFNSTIIMLEANRNYALRVQHYGFPSAVREWQTTISHNSFSENTLDLLITHVQGLTGESAIAATLQVTKLLDSIESIFYYTDITAQLGINAWKLAAVSELQGFAYSRSLERNFQEEYFRFGDSNPFFYTRTQDDFKESEDDQKKIAEIAVSGARYDYVTKQHDAVIDLFFQDVDSSFMEETVKHNTKMITYAKFSMGLTAVLMGIALLTTMYAIFAALMHRSSYFGNNPSTASASGQKKAEKEEQSSYRRKTGIILFFSIAIIAGLLIALLLLSINYDKHEEDNSQLLNAIGIRDWSVVEVLLGAQNIWFRSLTQDQPSSFAVQFTRVLEKAITARENLYLGSPDSTFGGLLSDSTEQDIALFGSDVYKWEQYAAMCRVSGVGRGFSIMDFPPGPKDDIDKMVNRLFSNGIENVVWQFIGLCLLIVKSPIPQTAIDYMVPSFSAFQYISTRLAESSQQYFEHTSASWGVNGAIFLVVAGILVAVIAAVVFFVLRPLLKHLVDEEEGTRLLLRMIPEKVRREVPAISDFFQTGTVNQDAELINDACVQANAMAIVVVDHDDNIIRVSQEMQRHFHMTEAHMLKQKVDILLSPDRALALASYREHRDRSYLSELIGKKSRMLARRGDGTLFPTEVFVREVFLTDTGNNGRGESKSCFVMRFYNVCIKTDIETVRRLQANVFDLSRQPQIVTDPTGVVRLANRATHALFGFDKTELIGFNVNVLMPPETARVHGQYLANFNTRVSKGFREGEFGSSMAINLKVSRRVVGMSKDGRQIPLELIIGAIFSSAGNVLYLVGHLNNLTDELLTAQKNLATQKLIEQSPLPFVIFDKKSHITVFSPAAERCWDHVADDVIGQSLNYLLAHNTAVRYNFVNDPKSDLKHFIGVTRTIEAKRSSGECFQVEVSMQECTQNNEPMVMAYFKDLTAEVKIVRHNYLNHTSFDQSPIPIVVSDEHGEIKSMNLAAEKQFGYPAGQAVGKNVSIIMPDHIASRHDGYLQRYRNTGVKRVLTGSRQEYAMRSDGRIFSVDIHLKETTVQDSLSETGFRRLFMAYIRDTSGAYQMEMANDVHNSVTHTCPVPMLSINAQGTILTFNMAAEELLQYEADLVIGQNVSILMPQLYAQSHDAHLRNYLLHRKKNMLDSVRTVIAKKSSGEEVTVEARVREVDRGTVSPIYVATFVDITALAQRKDEYNTERAFVSMYPDSIIVVDAKSSVRYFSDEASKTFGCQSADELIGMRLNFLLSTNDSQSSTSEHDATLVSMFSEADSIFTAVNNRFSSVSAQAQKEATEHTMSFLRRDTGLSFTARVVAKRLRGGELPKGRSTGITMGAGYGLLNRETATQDGNKVQSEEVLYVLFVHELAQEHLLRQSIVIRDTLLHDFDFIGALQIDETGAIRYANPTILRMLKFSNASELEGQDFARVMSPEAGKQYHMYIDRFIATGVATLRDTPHEVQALCKDGTHFTAEITVSHLELGDTKGTIQFFVFVRDSTAKVRHRNDEALMNELLLTAPLPAMLITYKPQGSKDVEVGKKKRDRRKRAAHGTDNYVPYDEMDDTDEKSTAGVHDTEGVSALSHGGVITVFNKAAEEQFQRSNDDVKGMVVDCLLDHGDAEGTLMQRYYEALAINAAATQNNKNNNNGEDDVRSSVPGSNTVSIIAKGVRENGSVFPARLTLLEVTTYAGATNDNTGSDSGSIGTPALLVYVEEISEHLQRQLELHISVTVADVAPHAVVCADQEGNIVLFSTQAEAMFGFIEKEIIGHNVSELMPPHMAEQHTQSIHNYMQEVAKTADGAPRFATRPVELLRKIARRKDGTMFPVEIKLYEAVASPPPQQQHSAGFSASLPSSRRGTSASEGGARLFVSIFRDTTNDVADSITGALCKASINAFGLPFFVLSSVGVFEQANTAFSDVFGYRRSELLGRNVRILMSPETVTRFDAYVAQRQSILQRAEMSAPVTAARNAGAKEASGHVTSNRMPLYISVTHKSGEEIPVELMLGDHNAEYLGRTSIFGFLRDVRDSVNLVKQRAFNETVTTVEKVAVLLVDNSGKVTHVNNSARQLFGYLVKAGNSGADVIEVMEGQPLSAVLPGASKFDEFIAKLKWAAATQPENTGVQRNVDGLRRDGVLITCTVSLREVSSNADEASYGLIITDVVQLATSKENELLMQVLQRKLLVGVVVATDDSVITYANRYVAEMFGFSSPDELLGQDLITFLTPHDAEDHHTHIESYLRGRKGKSSIIGRTRRLVGRRQDGTPVTLDLDIEEHVSVEGHTFVAFMEDLTESVRQDGEARVAESMMDSVPIVTLIVDQSGVISRASESSQGLLQQSASALIGRQLGTVISIRGNSSDGSATAFKASRHLRPGVIPIEVRTRFGVLGTMTVVDLTNGRMNGRVYMCFLQQT